jgi:hypothetical protein
MPRSPTALPTSRSSPDGLYRRDDLIAAIRARVIEPGRPRLVVLVILSLAGAAAFTTSVAALRLGLDSMALRYPLATTIGYLTFVVLIRVWIALQRDEHVPDPADIADAGDTMSELLPSHRDGPPEGDWFGGSFDIEEGWFVVLALACALGGVLALAYVIYIAPLLLAEVALDAALVSAVYRRLRREEIGWWAASVVRRTWIAATVLVVFMGIAGFALGQMAPDARSIGGVVAELLG